MFFFLTASVIVSV